MILRQVKIGPMGNFGYLLGEEEAKVAAVIDPSSDGRSLEQEAARLGLKIELILATHGHTDHVADIERLARETGAQVAAHRSSRIRKDRALEDGQRLELGKLEIEVIHTPGHTPDSVCYRVGPALFTGDTLFVGECGRVDLPGSDVRAMHDSLMRKIRGLDDELTVYPGHDYGPTPSARLGDEKRGNYTLEPRTLEEFMRFVREP